MKKTEQGTISQPQGPQHRKVEMQSLERSHMIRQLAWERYNIPTPEWQELNRMNQLQSKLSIARQRGAPQKELQKWQQLADIQSREAQRRWEESIQPYQKIGPSDITAKYETRNSRPPPSRGGAGRQNVTDLEYVQSFMTSIQEIGERRATRVVHRLQRNPSS